MRNMVMWALRGVSMLCAALVLLWAYAVLFPVEGGDSYGGERMPIVYIAMAAASVLGWVSWKLASFVDRSRPRP